MEGGGASLLSAADAAAAAEEAAAESGGGGAVPTAESGESSSFWPHTRILLEKNLKLKKQQYLIPSRVMRVPLPWRKRGHNLGSGASLYGATTESGRRICSLSKLISRVGCRRRWRPAPTAARM